MCSSEESWLKAAIFFGDNQRMFQKLSVDLESCADSAHKLTKSLLYNSQDHRPLKLVDDIVIRHDQADVDFLRDTTRLKTKLEDLVEQPDLGEEEKYLASYLIERENYRLRTGTDPHNPNPQHPNPPESGIPKFFEINRQYPMLGRNHKRGGTDGVTVIEAEWLGLKCAKKEFLKAMSIENFVKEVNALVALNHPNIVKLLCSRSVMPDPSFLMEFVEMSLEDFIEERKTENTPIKIVAAVDLMLQMALGMEYLHGQGVVHRDLKSPNILVYPSPHQGLRSMGYAEVKVTDFGLAKVEVFDSQVPTWKMRGTPHWIAPEAIAPTGRIDWRKADTYSFAITCSEILKCEVGAKSGSPDLPQGCPIYLSEFLQKCRDPKNPSNRPSFEEIVGTLKLFKMHLLLGTVPERAPEQVPEKAVSCGKQFWASTMKIKDKLFRRDLVVLPSSDTLTDPAEEDMFKATIRNIRSRLEIVASICSSMNEQLKQVQICHVQCDHLVKEYLEGIQKVKSTFDHVSRADLLNLFRSKKLQSFTVSLGRLICSMMAAEELVQACGGTKWKMTALEISAPLPSRVYSRFGIYLWELYWNLYVIHHVLHIVKTHPSKTSPQLLCTTSNLWFEWCDQRCRLILRRITNNGNEDAEDEFLEADAKRQAGDRHLLLKSLNESPVGLSGRDTLLPELAHILKLKLQSTWESVGASKIHLASHQDCYFGNHGQTTLQAPPKVVSRGGYKTVSECWFLGVRVALAVFDFGPQTEVPQEVFQTEVETLARVQHPNVVHFIGYADNAQLSVFMELMEDDLFNLIKRNMAFYSGSPFPLPVTVDILLQIVEAMIHVHQCGVLHRDLKPSNILVQPKYSTEFITQDMDLYYTVKLIDFYSSEGADFRRPLNNGDKFYTKKRGTVCYMAPEVWKSSSEGYTRSVDVWSFGMTAYHIVTGSKPLDNITHKELIRILRDGDQISLAFRDDSPVRLKELIEKCWAFKPETRPSFEQIKKELWTLKKDHDMCFDSDGVPTLSI